MPDTALPEVLRPDLPSAAWKSPGKTTRRSSMDLCRGLWPNCLDRGDVKGSGPNKSRWLSFWKLIETTETS